MSVPTHPSPDSGLDDYRSLLGLGDDDTITGEAVALDLPPASLGARMASCVIDVIITYLLLIAVLLSFLFAASGASERNLEALGWVAVVSSFIVTLLLFPATVETLSRGRSVGKLALGLRVVREDAGPISFHHAFVRALIGVVEIYAFQGGPAFFAALSTRRGKRLGDLAAGTYVVLDRPPMRLGVHVAMPAPLASWAATADIRALPTPLALQVRTLLTRTTTLHPAARQRLAVRLAELVTPYVAPAPPPGTHPETFLAAVVAGRRDRDLARLRLENDLRLRYSRSP
ncbi:MAG: RDD family protein [Nocardioides sp.]